MYFVYPEWIRRAIDPIKSVRAIVYIDKNKAFTVDKRGRVIHRSDEHNECIQAAVDEVLDHGGVIYIAPGRYSIYRGIKGGESVVIVGVRGKRNDPNYGTVLDYKGYGGEPVLDFTEVTWFGVVGIKILMNGKATYGLRCGTTSLDTRPKHLLIEDLEIDGGGAGTGLDFGDPSWAGVVDDTEIHRIVIRNCDKGVAGAHTQVKFYHLVLAGNKYGLYVKPSSQLNCYGCIFSGNEYDIMMPSGSDFVNQLNFFGCWFEGSTKGILAKEDTTTAAVGGINFYGCNFSCEADPTTYYAIDLEYLAVQVNFFGGRVNPSATNRKVRIGSNASVNAYHMQVEWDWANSVNNGILYVERPNAAHKDVQFRIRPDQQGVYAWLQLSPWGTTTKVIRSIIDLLQEDKSTDVAALRLYITSSESVVESSGFGTYTPVPLKLRYAGSDKIIIGDTIQKNGLPLYTDCSSIPASGDYTGEAVVCYDSTAAKWVLKVWDGSAWQTIG